MRVTGAPLPPGAGTGQLDPREIANLLRPFLIRRERGPSGAVLAVSGGPDSTVLLRSAAQLLPGEGLGPIVAATVDHGLRPEANAEAEQVAGGEQGWADSSTT